MNIAILPGSYTLGQRATGMGLRIQDFINAFNFHGYSITLIGDNLSNLNIEGVGKLVDLDSTCAAALSKLCAEVDCVLFNETVDPLFVAQFSNAIKIFDAIVLPEEYILTEKFLQRSPSDQKVAYGEYMDKREQLLTTSDVVIAGSVIQRNALLEQLKIIRLKQGSNRVKSNTKIIIYEPFVFFAKDYPENKAKDKKDIIWDGGLWNHFDSTQVARSVLSSEFDSELNLEYFFCNNTTHAQRVKQIAQSSPNRIILPETNYMDPGIQMRKRKRAIASAVFFDSKTNVKHLSYVIRLRNNLLLGLPLIGEKDTLIGDFVTQHGIGLAVTNTQDDISTAIKNLQDEQIRSSIIRSIKQIRDNYNLKYSITSLIDIIKPKGQRINERVPLKVI